MSMFPIHYSLQNHTHYSTLYQSIPHSINLGIIFRTWALTLWNTKLICSPQILNRQCDQYTIFRGGIFSVWRIKLRPAIAQLPGPGMVLMAAAGGRPCAASLRVAAGCRTPCWRQTAPGRSQHTAWQGGKVRALWHRLPQPTQPRTSPRNRGQRGGEDGVE